MKKIGFIWIGILLAIGIIGIGFTLVGKEKTEETIASEGLENRILPKPLEFKENKGSFQINKDTKIFISEKELIDVGTYLQENLKLIGKLQVTEEESKENYIKLIVDKKNTELGNEGYTLEVDEKGVILKGMKAEGIFRGIQTLKQLLPSEIVGEKIIEEIKWNMPFVEIKDKPEYEYRGIMIDVTRHFFSVEELKRQIDILSNYKINKLHLHLSDDQGFRLEIKKWPKLTEVGGKTAVNGDKGGYYTQEEFKELVSYAKERYIEIIPEIDMPGHTNAMMAAYDFLNKDGKVKSSYVGIDVGFSSLMCRDEKTYEFIEDIIKEIAEISPSKYIHIGGDEADATPKEDYDYFVGRVTKMVQKYGKTPIGWDPIDTSNEIDDKTVLQNWKDSNQKAVEKQMPIIVSNAGKAYLDMKYSSTTQYGLQWAGFNPIEDAYNWDPTDYAPKELVLGVEAPLFSENIKDRKGLDYMIYPRILGHAEIGWTPKGNRNFKEYKYRLNEQAKRLELGEVGYFKDSNIFRDER